MKKVKVGSVVQLKEGTRTLEKLQYGKKYIVRATVPNQSYSDDTSLITKLEDSHGEIINLKIHEGLFDIVWEVDIVKGSKKFVKGDKVISTKNTPEVPEGLVGYIVENDQKNYDYAVESLGIVEYFNEDELELLSAGQTEVPIHQASPDIARPILEERKIGKVQMNLFDEGFPNAVMEVAKVMTWAAENKGYKPHDWKVLPDAETEFSAAASRHKVKSFIQKVEGIAPLQRTDEESNIVHLAHTAFNVLAELELVLTGKIK